MRTILLLSIILISSFARADVTYTKTDWYDLSDWDIRIGNGTNYTADEVLTFTKNDSDQVVEAHMTSRKNWNINRTVSVEFIIYNDTHLPGYSHRFNMFWYDNNNRCTISVRALEENRTILQISTHSNGYKRFSPAINISKRVWYNIYSSISNGVFNVTITNYSSDMRYNLTVNYTFDMRAGRVRFSPAHEWNRDNRPFNYSIDNLTIIADDLPPPPSPPNFRNVQEIPETYNYTIRFQSDSSSCYTSYPGTSEFNSGWYDWNFEFHGLSPNTTYDFNFVCYNETIEGWLNLTGTTLEEDIVVDDSDSGDGIVRTLATPIIIMLSLVVVIVVTIPILRRPEVPDTIWDDEIPEPDIPEFDDNIENPTLPFIPAPDKMFLPEAPTPPPAYTIPCLATQVASVEDLPDILSTLKKRAHMDVCEENRYVLRDIKELEKRVRQLRDDGDIAPRKYDHLIREIEDLKRAVQNLTPLMKREDWDV